MTTSPATRGATPSRPRTAPAEPAPRRLPAAVPERPSRRITAENPAWPGSQAPQPPSAPTAPRHATLRSSQRVAPRRRTRPGPGPSRRPPRAPRSGSPRPVTATGQPGLARVALGPRPATARVGRPARPGVGRSRRPTAERAVPTRRANQGWGQGAPWALAEERRHGHRRPGVRHRRPCSASASCSSRSPSSSAPSASASGSPAVSSRLRARPRRHASASWPGALGDRVHHPAETPTPSRTSSTGSPPPPAADRRFGRTRTSPYSTRRSPLGAIEASTWGRSTTNSVRWAGKTCSLTSTGSPSTDRVTRSQRSTGEPAGTASSSASCGVGRGGADGLGGAAELDAEQLVERRPLDVGPRAARRRAASGHHTVTRAKGSPSARLRRRTRSTVSHAEHLAHPRRGGRRSGSRGPAGPTRRPSSASWLSMVPRWAERLAQRVGGDEPAEALAGVDQALVAQHARAPGGR